MVWGSITSDRNTNLAIIRNTINAERRLNILKTHILPFAQDAHDNSLTFMHHNAAIHRAYIFGAFFKENNIAEIDWLAKFQDLNFIENTGDYFQG